MPRTERQYLDRQDAGRVLGEQMEAFRDRPDVVVLGLPRGGVPVAAEVALALGAPLDVLVVRKLGVPGRPEVAMGAIAGAGGDVQVVWNEQLVARSSVSPSDAEAVERREREELARQEQAYRSSRPRAPLGGHVVVLVDDGLATGSTMKAAIAALRGEQPAAVVVAVPVASSSALAAVRGEGAEVFCPWVPPGFRAVSEAYVNFEQTSDEEVRAAIDRAEQSR